jgi:S-DNA-T family DNA segregation ATPase FtsK/SpoIIIE
LAGWSRAHPDSYDAVAAPWLRAKRRRWLTYVGPRWRDTLADCGLVTEHRRTGELMVPRLVRVRSASPSIDTLYVRMVRGQSLRQWTDQAEALAACWKAHRVAIAKHKPQIVVITIERDMPFTNVIPAPAIPGDASDVDFGALDIGDNEFGDAFTIPVVGHHILVNGATGSGKGSVFWSPLRALGPAIREGLVRVWVIDLKGGAETERGVPLFHRHATTTGEAIKLLTEVRDEMKARQQWMRTQGIRKCEISTDTPLDLVMIDEMAMLTAYGDRSDTRDASRLLAEIQTQGRATLNTVMGFLQEPGKDIVETRDLFTIRVCLRTTSDRHPDMVLGDGARERGALADEIPSGAEHAGIGYVIEESSRIPIRIRAAYVTDDEIDELVATCAPEPLPPSGQPELSVVA